MGDEVEERMEEVKEDPAILRAAASKDWDLVRSLAEKCDVDATGSDWQKTALYYAAEEGQADLVSLLLDKGANGNMKPFGHSDFTVLHRAAEKGHEDVVRLLLARGGAADLGVTDNGGETPLSLAVLGGHAGVVATLLAAGARVGVTESQQGRTPLHLAAVNGHVDVARQLLDAGSDINATDYEAGRTPLMLAAETGRVKMVDLLLQKSCDVMMGTVYREKNYIGSYLDFNNHPEAGDTTIHADDGATALHLAAQRGWVDVVELLLAKQPSLLQCRTRRGYTVLHYAAVGGGYDVVEMLLKKHRDSLDAEAVSEEGRTPLHDVVYSSPYDKVEERSRTSRAECIRLLVEAGWKVDAATKDGLTPLHVLADSNCYGGDRAAIARYLLDAGCDPNARTVDGRSALCLTSYPLDFHELLLERGCRVTVRDLQGAADLANYSVFKLLHSRLPASEWDPSAVDEDGSTLLHLAAQGCDTELLELLLDLGCDASARRRDGKTALHCSAQYISPSTLQLLVDRGCDINAQDCDGWTAMLYVMRANHGPGFTYIAKQFLDKGWDVNLRANDGTTALHMVMTMNLYETTEEVLRLLLDHGADATAQQDDGRTALQLLGSACSEEVLSMLEEAGCDPTATAKDGKNLLHDMAWHGDNWTAVLLAKGCDATARDQDGKTPLHYAAESSYDVTSLEQLISAGCDVAAAAADGTTALHLAARNHNAGSDELVKALLDGGADVQARDAEGRTPLHHAADLGQYHNEPHSLKRIRALIDAGADVNARSQDGWTPLHFAARCGALDVARLLLSSGASCSAADEPCRYTALHLAANCSNSMGIGSDLSKRDLVRLLVQGGCGVDSRSLDGSTALHLAAQGGRRQVARLLVDAGADLRAVALAGGDSDIVHRNLVSDTVARQVVRELLDSGCTVDARDEDGKTALERAAIKMTKQDIRWLLGQKEE